MKLNDVLKYYGGKEKSVPAVALALGLTPACIYGWIRKGVISKQSQILIELRSNGIFKAEK